MNLIGKTFYNLTVLDQITSNKQGRIWKCKCICGNITYAATGVLNNGSRKSCGCIHKGKNNNRWKGYNDIGGYYWGFLKSNAKRRNLEFNIDIQYAWELFIYQDKKCSLSNLPIKLNPSFSSKIENKDQTASLDRIDNNKGYIKNNVQWVHKDINIMKNNLTEDYFINLCKNVASHN